MCNFAIVLQFCTNTMEGKYIQRDMTAAIQEAASYFSVITVTGPRQSGKTTMLRHLFPHLVYYSLENLDVRSFAEQDPVAFLNQHEEGMILDEVHNVPRLLSYIQGIVDENPERRFILSGSSQFSLLKKVTQSLAGRTAVFELLPMAYTEIRHLVESKTIDELLLGGFYPAVWGGRNIPSLLYPAYLRTYIDKDVRDLLQIRDMMQFHTFLGLCAGRIGSVFKASELANEVGVSVHTITAWLSVLQASYIVTLLPPYFENTRKRLTKSPKLYFVDTGLACHLLGIETVEQLARDKMRGALFENFIVMEALKYRYNLGRESNLYFYRDSHQNEIDLVIKKPEGLYGVEIKSAMTYHADFEKTLRQMAQWVHEPVVGRAVVYTGTLENAQGQIRLLNYRTINSVLCETKNNNDMSLDELRQKVIAEYDSRNLKSSVRYNQLEHIVDYLKKQYGNSVDCLSRGKEILKEEYRQYREKEGLSGAEKSAFNEMYNQWKVCECKDL